MKIKSKSKLLKSEYSPSWVWCGDNSFGSIYQCSECNTRVLGMYSECPNCKTSMRRKFKEV